MGEVYRAVHMPTGRVVAVKMLTHSSSEVLQRFANEAKLQSSLAHPNIATVEAFFEAEGRQCLAMEYVDGQTLADRIQVQRTLPARDAFVLFRSIVAATAHLHSVGIVHRDLKPTNIRITSAGEVKLLDFGVAKSGSSPALTRVGNVVGTPLYLSPEQLRRGGASPGSDVWALGVLFYEMLTGRVPFEASTFPELWGRVSQGTFTHVTATAAAAPADRLLLRRADRLIARCLATRVENRPSSAALLDAVDRTLVAGPFGADLLAWLERTRRSLDSPWREPAWLGIAAGAALLTLVLMTRVLLPSPSHVDGSAGPVVSAHVVDVTAGRADVYVDGERKGETPYRYDARANEIVRLELRRPGYEALHQRFDITTRGTWTFTMRPLPTRTP